MTKKEIKDAFKIHMRAAENNQTDMKAVSILSPHAPSSTEGILTHEEILRNVNLYTREKAFNLVLDKGPYHTTYSRNGSNILLRNQNGYFAAYNTQHLSLAFEREVGDTVYDATWLYNEMYFASAQETALFIYDNKGVELHAVRKVVNPRILKFLPYHFLLAVGTSGGKLKYLDTSTGDVVADLFVREKQIASIASDPTSAVIHLGTRAGVVTLWAPAQPEYLAQINCHKGAVTNIEIERNGHRMVTTGLDNKIRVFDMRETYKPLKSIKTRSLVNHTALSQKNVLAIASGHELAVLRNFEDLYLRENVGHTISSVEYSPFEDILSIGHSKGAIHMVVPGSADQIYDSTENSPFMTTKQRQGLEIKGLLDKIPFDLIARENVIGSLEFSKREAEARPAKRYFEAETGHTDVLSRFRQAR